MLFFVQIYKKKNVFSLITIIYFNVCYVKKANTQQLPDYIKFSFKIFKFYLKQNDHRPKHVETRKGRIVVLKIVVGD